MSMLFLKKWVFLYFVLHKKMYASSKYFRKLLKHFLDFKSNFTADRVM